ncbi:MAG: transcription antitermination factor NusB [Terracidiphilus sp.]
MAAISPARKAAFEILLAVERGRGHSDELLRADAVSALSSADRNLATALVLGVLRWQLWIDRQIRPLLKRPDAKLDPQVLIALRLGAFQMMFLDRIPAHAAIDESVELAKQSGHRFASRMVNAVLRRLASPAILSSKGSKCGAPAEQAHPAWMVKRWVERYGQEAALAICRHGQVQPQLSLRLEAAGVESELVEAGIHLQPGSLLTDARTVLSGELTGTSAFLEGRACIQDEGSQLIGEIGADCCKNPNQNQKNILDLCAAPGGKTLILAERNPQAQIVACESNAKRLAELRERLAARASRVECRLADAAALSEDSMFDLALADVPCSGTGTLARNPEIRHRLRAEDLSRQAERQGAILRAAFRAVRPRGRILYSTCSLEPEENEEVIAATLAKNANLRQISLAPQIESLLRNGVLTTAGDALLRDCLTPEGALRLLPGTSPTDGFFLALLQRTDD